MFIRKMGKRFSVLDDKESELCRFDDLYTAALVYHFLNGGKLLDSERLKAVLAIQQIDGGKHNGTERVPEKLEKAEQG